MPNVNSGIIKPSIKQEIFDRLNKMYETRNILELYNRFLKESGRKPLPPSDFVLRYEDVYPLLYLKYAVCDLPKRSEVKHLVIDEMQDYSYLQYTILESLFSCRMTILGDRAQTIDGSMQDVTVFLPKIFKSS